MFKNFETDFWFKIADWEHMFIYSLPTIIVSQGANSKAVKSSADLGFQNIESKLKRIDRTSWEEKTMRCKI